MGRRLPPQAALPALLLLLPVFLAPAGPARAQEQHPLTPDHWSYELLEIMEGAGRAPVHLPLARPLTMGEMRRALGEVPLRWGRWLVAAAGPGVSTGYDRARPVEGLERGGFVGFDASVSHLDRFGAWAAGRWQEEGGGEVPEGGIVFSASPLLVMAGRIPLALGDGPQRLLLNGARAQDGILVRTRDGPTLPGPLEALGPLGAHLFLSPRHALPDGTDAWMGSMALALRPHPRVRLHGARTFRFGGEEGPSVTPGRVLETFFLGGQDSGFDDSQGEVGARVRWSLAHRSLVTYLTLAFEDAPGIYEDPGILAGLFFPWVGEEFWGSLRYEYLAMGRRGFWCGGLCDYVSHGWYWAGALGEYAQDGVPLGALLGGEGISHTLSFSYWGVAWPFRVEGGLAWEKREGNNLLLSELPGTSHRVRLGGVGELIPGVEAEIGLLGVENGGEWRGRGTLSLRVTRAPRGGPSR